MANIMQQLRAKNKVSRNGYDLNKRLCFTAKAGELLPTYSRLMMTGDTAEVGNFWETTTAPVNTAAYTRFKEYYEWYFVPIHLLWNKFNSWSVNMKNQNNVATSINGTQTLSDNHPFFTTAEVFALVSDLRISGNGETYLNQFGYNRGDLSAKLLSYLGYGDYTPFQNTYLDSYKMSPWRLLAYQKICQDYHRYSQWENSAPERYNINYISGSEESLQIPLDELDLNRPTMFDLQYANWNKDLFMGVLPSPQYGDASLVQSTIDRYSLIDADGNLNVPNLNTPVVTGVGAGNNQFLLRTNNSSETQYLKSIGEFSILALRQAEAVQKYKEITLSNPQDFPSQKDAHFGYRPNDAYSERSRLIHSVSSNIEIRPVINNNITENDDTTLNAADVAGYGHGTGGGKVKKFTADVDGVLMCIYHVVPLLDYALPRIDPDNLKTAYTDYAIPELDKIGMSQVPFAWLTNSLPFSLGTFKLDSRLLGYAPRYIEYKTDIDEVKGGFYNGGLEAWVSPITKDYINKYLFKGGITGDYSFKGLDYSFFKINPAITNSIFSGELVNSSVTTDKFWVNCYHEVKMVRPLDRDGLPY